MEMKWETFTFMKLNGVKFPGSTEKDRCGIETFRAADQVGTVFMEATFTNVKVCVFKVKYTEVGGGGAPKIPGIVKTLI
jgi:hypothetical protein